MTGLEKKCKCSDVYLIFFCFPVLYERYRLDGSWYDGEWFDGVQHGYGVRKYPGMGLHRLCICRFISLHLVICAFPRTMTCMVVLCVFDAYVSTIVDPLSS